LAPTNDAKDFFKKHELASSIVQTIHDSFPNGVERAKFMNNRENCFYGMYEMRLQILRGVEKPRVPRAESRRSLLDKRSIMSDDETEGIDANAGKSQGRENDVDEEWYDEV
jgi:hypothetical protein